MKFNQLYASFPKILETLATPFSGRKRKRDQAEIVEDSLSARPKKQSQTAAHPSGALAEAPSHHSNTRKAAAPAITQASLQQPADPYREATSQSAQAAYSSAKTRPVKDTPLQRYPLSNQAANAQLPSQVSNTVAWSTPQMLYAILVLKGRGTSRTRRTCRRHTTENRICNGDLRLLKSS